MKRFSCLLLIIFVFNFFKASCDAKAQEKVGVFFSSSYKEMLEELESFFPVEVLSSYRNTCRYKKLLILGASAYLKIKDHICPGQKIYLAGVMYPHLFVDPEKVVVISPLPSTDILKKYFTKWTIVYSSFTEYYVEYLSQHLDVIAFKVENLLELPQTLEQALSFHDRAFLLIPDPIFIDQRGRTISQKLFKRYKPFLILDLVGLRGTFIHKKEFKLPTKKFIKSIIYALDQEKGIYYCQDYEEVFPKNELPFYFSFWERSFIKR